MRVLVQRSKNSKVIIDNKVYGEIDYGMVLLVCFTYNDNEKVNEGWAKMNVLAVEMESAALYMNAARAGKRALCILTISDHVVKGTSLSADERQTGFRQMMEVALETVNAITE